MTATKKLQKRARQGLNEKAPVIQAPPTISLGPPSPPRLHFLPRAHGSSLPVFSALSFLSLRLKPVKSHK